jgi:hypothetical protein
MSDEPGAETQCPECLEPLTYLWVPGGGIVSSPEYVLVADWMFHSQCWVGGVKGTPAPTFSLRDPWRLAAG